MRARVYVSLKKTVLDPQGETICAALRSRGYHGIATVRQGKVFDVELTGTADPSQMRLQLEEVARDVLANPVIEEYRVELE
jgi:phosphoribosylformylglycinamidine synthase